MIKTWLTHNIIEFAINHVLDRWTESIHQTDIVYGHQLNEKYYNLMVKEFYNMAHIFTIGDTSVVNVINMQLISKDNSNLYKSSLMKRIDENYPERPFWIKILCSPDKYHSENYVIVTPILENYWLKFY